VRPEYKDMPHGWVSRAKKDDPKQVAAQTEAWGMALEWANKYVGSTCCCPPGSLPKRAAGPHTPKGKYIKVGDMDVYVSGEGKNGAGILVNPEVFGIRGGDLAEICDMFADNGYMAVLPDYHRGGFFTEFPKDFSVFVSWVAKYPWSGIEADLDKHILPIFHKAGVKKIGGVGFCYGTYVTLHAAAAGKIQCVMNCHPSHTHAAKFQGEDGAKLAASIKCPVLQLPAGADPEDNQPGGSDEKSYKANCGEANVCVKAFKEMPHGWVSRAKKDDPKQVEAQTEAWCLLLNFANKHLVGK